MQKSFILKSAEYEFIKIYVFTFQLMNVGLFFFKSPCTYVVKMSGFICIE